VIVQRSETDAALRCVDDEDKLSCLDRHRSDNEDSLQKIASVVEIELLALGVPRRLFSSVFLLPMCRLGSHSSGSERDSPCAASFWSAQYVAGFFSYALVGPHYRVRCLLKSPMIG
jgi:hypothetical protein